MAAVIVKRYHWRMGPDGVGEVLVIPALATRGGLAIKVAIAARFLSA